MKDEAARVPVIEFVRLKAKMYCFWQMIVVNIKKKKL